MGLLDEISNSINRGTEAVGRGTRTAQLKYRMGELLKERQKFAAQLGAGLYDKLKDDPAMREGMESLFDGIASIDRQRADMQAEIDSIEAAGAASAAAAVTYQCPRCGTTVGATDMFCAGCGKPVEEIKAAAKEAEERRRAAAVASAAANSASASSMVSADAPFCSNCGAVLAEGDAFCMSCGAPVVSDEAAAAEPDNQTALDGRLAEDEAVDTPMLASAVMHADDQKVPAE